MGKMFIMILLLVVVVVGFGYVIVKIADNPDNVDNNSTSSNGNIVPESGSIEGLTGTWNLIGYAYSNGTSATHPFTLEEYTRIIKFEDDKAYISCSGEKCIPSSSDNYNLVKRFGNYYGLCMPDYEDTCTSTLIIENSNTFLYCIAPPNVVAQYPSICERLQRQ